MHERPVFACLLGTLGVTWYHMKFEHVRREMHHAAVELFLFIFSVAAFTGVTRLVSRAIFNASNKYSMHAC